MSRVRRLESLLSSRGIDVAIITPGSNMAYLTGFREPPMERPIMLAVGAGGPLMVVPKLYEDQVRGVPADVVAYRDGEDPFQLLKRMRPAKSIAMDDYAFAKDFAGVSKAYGAQPSLLGSLMSQLRRVKSPREVELMGRAVQLSEAALSSFMGRVEVGMTGHEAARLLKSELESRGLELAFEPIVTSGPDSAMPHLTHTDRRIERGDSLVVDFGGRLCGYNADITRTFFVGHASDEEERVYGVVLDAQTKAEEAARPGVEAGSIDGIARRIISDAGYGGFFIHRTGHGLGMDVHEEPYIVQGNGERLEEGNVFTVEPGIYLPGRFGVRIEDDIAIMGGQARRLNEFPRELTIIGNRR